MSSVIGMTNHIPVTPIRSGNKKTSIVQIIIPLNRQIINESFGFKTDWK